MRSNQGIKRAATAAATMIALHEISAKPGVVTIRAA
jgi:hypothetical protein